ncbi:enterobactin synthase subunit EntD [Enterobacter cloacae complex sp. 2024EL-00215]|uniref:enterobactin synthase subunit EntD n=1 Tax=unclassified Enterobacter cloacae complex TaxID=2757714 RepID=UPI00375368E4
MHTTYSTFLLAGQTVHHVEFDPTTFTDADLLWLPHHAHLTHAGRKRKTDHLAGRIAAAHALHALNEHTLPGIGSGGEPLWPEGISGSITHSGVQAMAIAVRDQHLLTGIDCEAILPEREAKEIKDGVINAQEETCLLQSGYPFGLALTLTFSAKESVFKALFPHAGVYMGFDCAQVIALDDKSLTLALSRTVGEFNEGKHFTLAWKRVNGSVFTLASEKSTRLSGLSHGV